MSSIYAEEKLSIWSGTMKTMVCQFRKLLLTAMDGDRKSQSTNLKIK